MSILIKTSNIGKITYKNMFFNNLKIISNSLCARFVDLELD